MTTNPIHALPASLKTILAALSAACITAMVTTSAGAEPAISVEQPLGKPLPITSRVAAWGTSHNGETAVPDGLDDVVAIDSGNSHTLALRANGKVVAWGYNERQGAPGQTDVPRDWRMSSQSLQLATSAQHSRRTARWWSGGIVDLGSTRCQWACEG